MEITTEINLSEEEQAKMELHSFLNIMNILMGELQLIRLDLGRPGAVAESYAMAENVLAGVKAGRLTKELALELSSINFYFAREIEEAVLAASGQNIDESVDNIRSILNVVTVRLREYFERQNDGMRWQSHRVSRLTENFLKFFAAVEKNSRGRYHIIFNVAAKEPNDYLVNLKIEGRDGGEWLLMPPVMQDVFRDLIANARKYTPAGGEVTAGLLQDERELRLVVADNGCGILPADLEHVVEFGFRGNLTKGQTTKGGGFGLTKAYVTTRQLGGKMWIESEIGKGTRVTIHIPLPDKT